MSASLCFEPSYSGIDGDSASSTDQSGQFHIYPIAQVDQGRELLTGVPARDAETRDTMHGLVNAHLQQLARDMMAFGETRSNGTQKRNEVNAFSA